MAAGPQGDLFVTDQGTIYGVTLDGTVSVFVTVPDARGNDFDAFGHLLVPSPANGTVYRVSPTGEVTPFLTVFNPRRARTGPDGSIWIATIDSLHHFDAVGRYLESFDVMSQGGAAFGLRFSPSGELYFTSWAGYWKLENGAVVPVLTGLTPRQGAPNFDELGNSYRIFEAVGVGDTDRVILADSDFATVDDTLVSQIQAPCSAAFARDAAGDMTNRFFVGQRDGTLVEVNSAAIAAPGWPTVGLEIDRLDEDDCAGTVVGMTGLITADQSHFLDVIGNNNGSYDVGDFRAYLIATGITESSSATGPRDMPPLASQPGPAGPGERRVRR
jgi:hypothetical protein